MLKLIRNASICMILVAVGSLIGQTPAAQKPDNRPSSPVVGGPVDIFTVYDGTMLRKGEYKFSEAYTNYDEDEKEPSPLVNTSLFLYEDHTKPTNLRLTWSFDGFRVNKKPQTPICSRRIP